MRPFPDVEDGKWQVSTNGGMAPRWSNDGREIFFQNGATELVAAQVDTRDGFIVLERVTLFQIPQDFIVSALTTTAYDVTADGQRFIMVRAYNPDSQNQVEDGWVLVNNWFEELKERVGN